MKLSKKLVSKDRVAAVESPVWGSGAMILASLKR